MFASGPQREATRIGAAGVLGVAGEAVVVEAAAGEGAAGVGVVGREAEGWVGGGGVRAGAGAWGTTTWGMIGSTRWCWPLGARMGAFMCSTFPRARSVELLRSAPDGCLF